MKLEKLTNEELIEEFERFDGWGVSDYVAFTREFVKRLKGKKMTKQELQSINGGTRELPACFLFHKGLEMYVPIIEFEQSAIVWDDNQWSRTDPPEKMYELGLYEEFDLEMPAVMTQSHHSQCQRCGRLFWTPKAMKIYHSRWNPICWLVRLYYILL